MLYFSLCFSLFFLQNLFLLQQIGIREDFRRFVVVILLLFEMDSKNMSQKVPQFDGKIYDVWYIKMKIIFFSQEL